MTLTTEDLKILAEEMLEAHTDETSCKGCAREQEPQCSLEDCFVAEGWCKCPACVIARKILEEDTK